MGCCFCCLSEDDKIDRIFDKIEKATGLDRLEPGVSRPVLVNGKVIAVSDDVLDAPVTGKSCIYYEVKVEREEEREREVERDGRKHKEKYYVWVHHHTVSEKRDFKFVDEKIPSLELLIPLSSLNEKTHSTVDGHTNIYGRGQALPNVPGFRQPTDKDWTGKLRYSESSFHVSEVIAVIGNIEEYMETDAGTGEVTVKKKLCNMQADLLSEEYAEKHGWTDWDKRAWADLLTSPSVILTDISKHTNP